MKNNAKKIIPAVVILALAAAIAFKVLNRAPDFTYAGTIEATQVDLSTRLGSLIAEVKVREGDSVAKDHEVLQLASDDLRLAADAAATDFARAARLFQAGSLSREAYDHIRLKRDETAMRLSWSAIRSPVAGKVLGVHREAGEWAAPGMKLLTVADLSRVWAVVYVAQPMLAGLKLGAPVTGRLVEMESKAFPGKIIHISDEAEFTPKNVQTREERTRLVFGVKVEFENPEDVLKPGMPIEVELQ